MDIKKPVRPRKPRAGDHASKSDSSNEETKPSQKRSVKTVLTQKRTLVALSVGLLVIAGGFVFWMTMMRDEGSPLAERTIESKPKYETVIPKGEEIADLGDWRRVSPPEKDPVFAYSDTLGGTTISVSQQPIPDSFKDDVSGKVANLAKSYSATDIIEADKTKAYIGTSSKGPQSVILAKNGVLVLIKSKKIINDEMWAQYIKSLDKPGTSRLPKY